MKRLWLALLLSGWCGIAFADTTFEFNPVTKKLDLTLDNSNAGVITGITATFTGYNCTVNANGGALTTDASGNLKCSDDDTGAGGGDAITVNGGAATDPDFADSATIAWTLTTALSPDQISGIVVADSIGATQLADVDFGDFTCADGSGGCLIDANAVALTTDTTGNYVEDLTCSETMSGCVAAGEDTNQLVGVKGATLTKAHLNATNAPTPGQLLSYSSDTNGQFTWITAAGSVNSFETWAVPTGTNPVADATNDTVTFTASGITVTGTAGTDTIDFTTANPIQTINGDVSVTFAGLATITANAVALTTDTSGSYLASLSCAETVSGCNVATEGDTPTLGVKGATLTRVHLNSLDLPADEEVLTFETTTGQFEWQSDAGGNVFTTFDVPAGTDPVADAATDTLTITETSFLTITGDSGTDTIDITQVTTDLGSDGLIAVNAVALTTDTTGSYVEDLTCSETMSGCVAAGEDTNQLVGVKTATLTKSHLNVTNAPTAGQLLAYDSNTTGKFVWRSAPRCVQAVLFEPTAPHTTGDGKAYLYIDSTLNGYVLSSVSAGLITTGTTGTVNVDLAKCANPATGDACSGTVTDLLSTNVTIDSGEDDSSTAAAAAVISTTAGVSTVTTGDWVRFDVDAVNTTVGKGLNVTPCFSPQ